MSNHLAKRTRVDGAQILCLRVSVCPRVSVQVFLVRLILPFPSGHSSVPPSTGVRKRRQHWVRYGKGQRNLVKPLALESWGGFLQFN